MEIPLTALGVENIREGMELAVQIARNNVSTYGKKREASVWAALEKMDYSDTARWGTAVFAADDASEPRFVRGPDNGASVNLFANPEFDVPDRGWTDWRFLPLPPGRSVRVRVRPGLYTSRVGSRLWWRGRSECT